MPRVELLITWTLRLTLLGLVSAALPAQWGGTTDEPLYSIPRSQDDIHEVRLADREIREQEFTSAVERLHLLLRRGRKGLLEIVPGRYVGMRSAIIGRLRDMPEGGLAAYEKLTSREAGDLVRTAFVGRNFEGLRVLAGRFPTSIPGRKARLRLGDLWLEAGRGGKATLEYSRLLEAMATRDPARGLVRARLTAAQTLVNRKAGDAEILALADSADSGMGWISYGGGRDGTSSMRLPNALGRDVVKFQLASPGYGSYYPLTVHAAGGLGGLYFNTGHKVIAHDPIGGRRRWESEGPMVGSNDRDAYYETLSKEMLLSCAVSPNVIVAALQVPNATKRRSFHQLELLYKLPSRRLFAFDRHTGKRLWAHWDYQTGPRSKIFVAHNAPSPPIIEGDTVYAPTNDPTGAIAYYLAAYELRTGKPRWRTLICSSQGEVNMFGNAKIEYAATPVALYEGVLYGTTNLGLCYAADAATGRVRWCSSYPIIPLPRTRLRGQPVRQVFFANNPIIVSHGVMLCTPLDSEHVLGLDIKTGKILWKLHWRNQANHQNNLKWMIGVQRDEVILTGNGVVGVKIRPDGRIPQVRQIRKPQSYSGLSSRIARGAVAGDHIVHPMPEGLSVFDAAGNAHARQFPIQSPGNMLMVDGIVVSARANGVQIYLDHDGLMELARAAIKKDRANPANYLRLAMLLRGGKRSVDMSGLRGENTVKLLRQGIKAATKAGLGGGSPMLKSLTSELFKISMLRAESESKRGAKDRALTILQRARDESGDTGNWIVAQLKILTLLEGSNSKYLAELQRLSATHGHTWHKFPEVGRMPVRPYTIWKSVPYLTKRTDVIARCQDLLEDHPDVHLQNESGRDFALRTISALLERHGRKIYAAIETRAEEQLLAAGADVVLLRGVDRRFPHSLAADKARNRVLDQAVMRGDLATAAAMARRSDEELDAGMLRRLMIAAGKAGNVPLCHALGQRLLRHHADESSDFPTDKGRKISDVVTLPKLPTATVVHALPPTLTDLKTLENPGRTRLDILDAQIPHGYSAPKNRLLYVAAGINELRGYDLTKDGTDPVFSVRAQLRLHILTPDDELLRLCGDRLIVNEGTQLRALHSETGEEIWTQPAGKKRSFQVIGVQSGIIHAFSTLSDHGDGGSILGFDALSGAQLFTHVFPVMSETIAPIGFVGDLWTLHVPRGTARVEVHRIDGVTGRLRHKFTIPTSIQTKLGMKADRSGIVRVRAVQSSMLVDESSIYLPVGDSRTKPFVAAFAHKGAHRWNWKSPATRANLKYAAMHGAKLVLLEETSGRRSSSRIIVIDKKNGLEKKGTRFAGLARILNIRPEPFAPNLLIVEINAESTALLGYSLDNKVPSFRYNTNKRPVFWHHPVIGKTFLAAPFIDSSGSRMELLVIDLKTKKTALPGTKKSRPLPRRSTGYRIVHHGARILCQSQKGIQILSNAEDKK
jgi:outer membrane protein assembly factor BamB